MNDESELRLRRTLTSKHLAKEDHHHSNSDHVPISKHADDTDQCQVGAQDQKTRSHVTGSDVGAAAAGVTSQRGGNVDVAVVEKVFVQSLASSIGKCEQSCIERCSEYAVVG